MPSSFQDYKTKAYLLVCLYRDKSTVNHLAPLDLIVNLIMLSLIITEDAIGILVKIPVSWFRISISFSRSFRGLLRLLILHN
jgi:hypothetical protein